MDKQCRHIALMGGSYNPVHIGHIMVADYVRQVADIDEVLMCVSPLNPLKIGSGDLA
ncbi:MAG: nicotinate-nucleotide adenylyltransferase, partial [Muribaculaceae bacterium]|nr:nicotinate-nucleotide adenylyltransferase [Muribaculaceae bacterium]